MEFNEDLAIIHSYLCADGYVIKNPKTQKQKYYHIGFRNTNFILLMDFHDRFLRFFKIEPRVNKKDGRAVVQNKGLYYSLTKDYSYYSKEWRIPNLNDVLLCSWLRAFFDCESWVTVRKAKDRSIGMDSVNHKGLKHIKTILRRLGINSKMRKLPKRNISRLMIYGKENIIKFKEKIGFLHSDKKQKLNRAINSYVLK